MKFILEGAGIFIYPLLLCSFVGIYIIFERLVALRESKIVPRQIASALLSGKISDHEGDLSTTVGRILFFNRNSNPDPEALKAFAQLEMTRLERGMFALDIVISAAPLLVTVFASGEASPTPEAISRGVALALSTTILGLCIAIPAIVGNSYLNRKIDKLCAQINICVERLIDIRRESGK